MSARNLEEVRVLVLKNPEIVLEDDEIVKYSLRRLAERKIEDELCGRTRDIVDLDLQMEDNNLILKVKVGSASESQDDVLT